MANQNAFHLLPQVPKTLKTEFATPPSGQSVAWSELLKVMQDVWKNEETRFSNLNTRGVAVVSVTAVITTILGFISKDLFITSATIYKGWPLTFGRVALTMALVLLVGTIGMIVIGVLRPGGRAVFGLNDIVGTGYGDRFQPGTLTVLEDIDRVTSVEYLGIYTGLVNRNQWKAYWLNWSYYALFLGILISAAAIIPIVWLSPVTH